MPEDHSTTASSTLTSKKRSLEDEKGQDGSSKDLEEIKKRLLDMEAEAEMLHKMNEAVSKELHSSSSSANKKLTTYTAPTADTALSKEESDSRSIYVGNVDYSVTPEELQTHFNSAGPINRITIQSDKWTGQPKGFAYIEFAETSHVSNALALNESILKGRAIKVTPKRTNIPGMAPRGRGRGGYRMVMVPIRGGRGGYRGRGGFRRGAA